MKTALVLATVLAGCASEHGQDRDRFNGSAQQIQRDCIRELWRKHIVFVNGLGASHYCFVLSHQR